MVLLHGNMAADSLMTGAEALSHSAESYVNDPNVEFLWARSAHEHAEIHYNLLCSVDVKFLRLTPIDDQIYSHFRAEYPNMKVDCLDEDHIKSADQKATWREFCEKYKNRVENYNFATLLRLRCDKEYTSENTTIAPRVQFYAIEIARNREGCNDLIRKLQRPESNENDVFRHN